MKTRPRINEADVKHAAAGRWVEVLSTLGGLSRDSLDGRHGPCPKCGGTDRFRFVKESDEGRLHCNQCFASKNGDGIAAMRWLTGWGHRETLNRLADYFGCAPAVSTNGHTPRAKTATTKDPDASLEFLPWSSPLAGLWCLKHKPGTSEPALVDAGAHHARHTVFRPKRKVGVLALPVFSAPDWTAAKPTGWVLFDPTGREVPTLDGSAKNKLVGKSGLMGRGAIIRLCEIPEMRRHDTPDTKLTIWKVEGPSDMLALWTKIPEGQRYRNLVTTNAAGCGQNVKPEWLPLFAGHRVFIVHDADKPGEDGAPKWTSALAPVADDVRHVRLPFEVAPDHGKDLRDWLNEGGTFEELCRMAEESPSVIRPADKADSAVDEQPASPLRPTISNGEIVELEDEKGRITRTIRPWCMTDIMAKIRAASNGWPKRIGGALFVDDTKQGVGWLASVGACFGWLQESVGMVFWHRALGCPNKDEVFCELQRTSPRFVAVEVLPHQPPMEGHYYIQQDWPNSGGEALRALIARFDPETDIDRDLILAMFATTLWGGPGGARPAFVVTADKGRGIGKSKVSEMVGYLLGGIIELSANEDAGKMRGRLLSPEGLTKRLARLDNVKTLRFSWAELESLITAPVVSGHRMYVGEGQRPNTLTLAITLNGASLSTDMAQRSVIIKMKKPQHSADWESEIKSFIDKNRRQIIGDLLEWLQGPVTPLERHSRWGTWERDILARLPEPNDAQRVILERQKIADVEDEEAELIEECFADKLSKCGFSSRCDRVHIPSAIACDWLSDATNHKYTTTGATRTLTQLINEGKAPRLMVNLSKIYGRGFIWQGEEAGNYGGLQLDLPVRISGHSLAT